MVAVDSPRSGSTHQSELNMACGLLTGDRVRNGSADGGQSCRNWYRRVDDFNIDTSLFGIYILGKQAAMVR